MKSKRDFLSNLGGISAQAQNAVHVIQIGNTFYDVIPITDPSASGSRCNHHSHCRRSYNIRHSGSNPGLNDNSHTNPTFVLDEGIYPSGNWKLNHPKDLYLWYKFICSATAWSWSSPIVRRSHSIAQPVPKTWQLIDPCDTSKWKSSDDCRDRSQRSLHHYLDVSVASCNNRPTAKHCKHKSNSSDVIAGP